MKTFSIPQKEQEFKVGCENNDLKIYAGGWFYTKLLFVLSASISLSQNLRSAKDLFENPDMRFAYGLYSFSAFYEINSAEASLLCVLGFLGLVGVLFGGRLFFVGLIIWILSQVILETSEALNIKAYDRFLFFFSLVLLLSPAYKKNIRQSHDLPYARYLLMVLVSSLYISTGMLKLLHEPGWFNGQAMMFNLNHRWHGGSWIALWLSTQPLLVLCLGVFTVFFELLAGMLIWFRVFNPIIIFLGLFFHLGIYLLMDVGYFSLVVIATYPVVLCPVFMTRAHSYYEKTRLRVRS